jgi:hypothetical protein
MKYRLCLLQLVIDDCDTMQKLVLYKNESIISDRAEGTLTIIMNN